MESYEELLNSWVKNMDTDAQKATCIQFGLIEGEENKPQICDNCKLINTCIIWADASDNGASCKDYVKLN